MVLQLLEVVSAIPLASCPSGVAWLRGQVVPFFRRWCDVVLWGVVWCCGGVCGSVLGSG